MYTIIRFSPTGNAAYISERLADSFESETRIMDLEHTDPAKLSVGNHLIFVFAIHAFNAPKTVKRFIRNLPMGLCEYVSLVSVGCNKSWVNGAVSKDVRTMLERKSYKIVVDETIAMPLNIIINFPEDVIRAQLTQALLDVEKISRDIEALSVTHKTIAIKSHIVNFLGRVEPLASRFFGLELHTKTGCTDCGLCIRECPEKNVKRSGKGKICFGFKCIMCMRCIYNCPVSVITPRISKFIPLSKRYSINKYLKQ
ncbi:MAG: EFR1 family ferrodoxin [Bacillota bacterium]